MPCLDWCSKAKFCEGTFFLPDFGLANCSDNPKRNFLIAPDHHLSRELT